MKNKKTVKCKHFWLPYSYNLERNEYPTWDGGFIDKPTKIVKKVFCAKCLKQKEL